MIDPAQRPALDDLADLADRRHEAVVEGHHVLDAGLLHRIQHRLRLFGRAPQRLLAQDVLARLRRHDRRLRVRVVRAAVVKQLHPVVVQHLPPVGVVALIAKTHRRRTRGLFVAPADGDHLGDRRGRIDHVRQLLHGVAVRLAHKGIAQHADADFRRFVFRCRGCHRGKAGTFSHSEFSFSLNGGVVISWRTRRQTQPTTAQSPCRGSWRALRAHQSRGPCPSPPTRSRADPGSRCG